MRIGINLLCILPGVNGGVEMYAVSTLRALAVRYSSHRYVAFVNQEGTRLSGLDAPNITTVVCDFNARSRELRYAWEQFMLPRQVRRQRKSLVKCLCSMARRSLHTVYFSFGDYSERERPG